MPARLTPIQALEPDMVERLAMAEWTYDRIMTGWLTPPLWDRLSDAKRDVWRAKARELLTDLVAEST